MTFREWQALSPIDAAREIHTRVAKGLRPGQARAAIATLQSEDELVAAFGAADRSAPLGGVPFFVKDLFDVAGLPTRAGSTFLPEVRPTPNRDAECVRAFRSAGATFAGKTHTHEFAYGVTGENPNFGDCEHPRFPGRTTGGSSSGSVAVVAAGIAPLALGSDTGGSVRVPAAFCGLFGFRLTPRDRWIADAFPLSPSFDTAGWFTAHAVDMKSTLRALLPAAPAASTPRGCFLELPDVDPEVAHACRAASERFAAPADTTVANDLRAAFSGAREAYNTIVAREAWDVHKTWADANRERYDPAVWQRLNRVHSLTPVQETDARAAVETICNVWRNYFRSYDFLVLPASPKPALTKAECNLENRMRILTVTAPASIGGYPVLTIPVPLASGLTTGLQIVVADPRSPVLNWALDRCQ